MDPSPLARRVTAGLSSPSGSQLWAGSRSPCLRLSSSWPHGWDVRAEAHRPEWPIGRGEEHPAQDAAAGAQRPLRLQRVPHHEDPAAGRGERQRVPLRDQGGHAAGHRRRRLHRARGVLRQSLWHQQGGRAGCAGPEPHLRAGRGPAGCAQHQEDRPAAHLHLRAAALAGRAGAAAAAERHGDGGEPGQAAGSCQGRHGEQQGARPVRPGHHQRQTGRGLPAPEGGALRGNQEGAGDQPPFLRTRGLCPSQTGLGLWSAGSTGGGGADTSGGSLCCSSCLAPLGGGGADPLIKKPCATV
ncbi:guanylate kinase isoform X1 [Talpa occidentalis]|uniref:guanylate kinase isoform X1 n=1 Tax=Talpa occidentalis TaxID=50954 RepID=UPI00188F46F2|nr:guanylate kinase isoform X1 [Talpa occidentalis]XP_037355305.1 guanylate kinase isoform X1 [Talpa occidentalis]XP_037355306.1 guanylate kinase isoform X1 [Talpa occidentalis]